MVTAKDRQYHHREVMRLDEHVAGLPPEVLEAAGHLQGKACVLVVIRRQSMRILASCYSLGQHVQPGAGQELVYAGAANRRPIASTLR